MLGSMGEQLSPQDDYRFEHVLGKVAIVVSRGEYMVGVGELALGHIAVGIALGVFGAGTGAMGKYFQHKGPHAK